MTKAFWDAIETAMTGLGYVLAADESGLSNRKYTITVDTLPSENEVRGAMFSGKVRVGQEYAIRVQYQESKRDPRRSRDIAVDQETIIPAIAGITANGWTGHYFVGASMEEAEGGSISVVLFHLEGTVS